VLHERVVIFSAEPVDTPHVPSGERVMVDELGYSDDNITQVTARYGFQDRPDIPRALRLARSMASEANWNLERPSFFLSRITIRVTAAPGMARWRKKLFVAIACNAASPVGYFGLSDDRTITMGSQIRL
jgi:KUP system potassium uptake protein